MVYVIIGIVVVIMAINWIPILLFVGFSGGFRRSGHSSTTYKYDKETCILSSETWYTNSDKKLNEQFIFKNDKWYTYPDMKKCNKKDTERYNTQKELHNG